MTQPTPDTQIPNDFHYMLSQGLTTSDGVLSKDNIELWQPLPITLGSYVTHDSDPWIGLDMTLFTQATGTQIDGLLGIEIFRQLSWAVNNNTNTLDVWKHAPSTLSYQHCMPYNDAYGRSPELLMYLKSNSNWMSLRVDTGAVYTQLSDESLKYLRDNRVNVLSAGNQTPTATASGLGSSNDYLIDNLFFNNTAIGRLKVSQRKNENFIGMNFLARFDNYLFMPNKMMFCYNATNFTRYDTKPIRRIFVRYFAKRIELFYNDPAELVKYGLQNKDILLAINGEKVIPARMGEIGELLSNTPSGALKLLIERNGSQKTLKL